MKKRSIAFLLALVMIFSLATLTGCGKKEATGAVTMTIISHPSWPYREDWKVWQYIQEESGFEIQRNVVPSSDYFTKYSVMFASKDSVTDLTYFDYKPDSDVYTAQGCFVAFEDLKDQMPNYNKFIESLSDEEFDNIVKVRRFHDGKIYYAPATGREKTRGIRAWLYRKDIFEKNNLAVPTTFDEVYEVCKTLKKLYPNSYPFCMRSGLGNLSVTGDSWQPWWALNMYYDYDAEQWKFGAREAVTKEIVTWYKKMVDEKLLQPDFFSISSSEWEELISTDRGFIMPEYQTRIDNFAAIPGKTEGFELQAMVPPLAKETGRRMTALYNYEPQGLAIANTGKQERINNAARLVDWFYSDEAVEICSWGREGETFEVVDGKKQYITDANGSQANTMYGFSTYGTFLRMDPEANDAFQSERIKATQDMVLEHTAERVNPITFLAFNKEEQKVRDKYETTIKSYAEEQVTKFILGQRPISEFDAFVNELNKMGVDELLAVYESAYNRVK